MTHRGPFQPLPFSDSVFSTPSLWCELQRTAEPLPNFFSDQFCTEEILQTINFPDMWSSGNSTFSLKIGFPFK